MNIYRIMAENLRRGGGFVILRDFCVGASAEIRELLQKDFAQKMKFEVCDFGTLISSSRQLGTFDIVIAGNMPEESLLQFSRKFGCLLVSNEATTPFLQDICFAQTGFSKSELKKYLEIYLGLIPASEKLNDSFAGSLNGDFKHANHAPCLFLDRDDVVVKNVPYNSDPQKVELIAGIENLIQSAHQAGYLVIICSNQSGLGREKISEQQYISVHQKMLQLLAQKQTWIDDTEWAPFIESTQIDEYLTPQLRKPRPGMFHRAQNKWNINFKQSLMIGDSATDLIAAFVAGVTKLYLFHSDKAATEQIILNKFKQEFAEFNFELIQNPAEVKLPISF